MSSFVQLSEDTMASTTNTMSVWEKLDCVFGNMAMSTLTMICLRQTAIDKVFAVGAALYAALTGPFRGAAGATYYKAHVMRALVKKMCNRLSIKQLQ